MRREEKIPAALGRGVTDASKKCAAMLRKRARRCLDVPTLHSRRGNSATWEGMELSTGDIHVAELRSWMP
eukprot:6756044-Lingulodinium_polyedra.AAC.1